LKALDRSFFCCFIRHFNEGESTFAAGVPLKRKGAIHNFTELGKQFDHIFLLSAEGEIANENAHV
jgi:hypothetical protein